MRCFAVLFLLAFTPTLTIGASDNTLHIAVASNFKPTLEKISAAFTTETQIPVTISGASSGALANQILQGAPFHLFFAADRERPEAIHTRQHPQVAAPFCYALGRLALTGTKAGAATTPNASITQLADPELSLAIANPNTAPYGRAAMSVLSRAQFDAGQDRKLVRAGNAMQAYQFWYTGAVDLALLPRSLATDKAALIPDAWHEPLEQYAIALRSGANVDAYLKWLKSDSVRALVQQAGYEPCP